MFQLCHGLCSMPYAILLVDKKQIWKNIFLRKGRNTLRLIGMEKDSIRVNININHLLKTEFY